MVKKVRRNDPCPCGSGKKFKHCCMKSARAATVRKFTIRQESIDLMSQIYRFSHTPLFSADLEAAFTLFWNDSQALAAVHVLESLDMVRFFDWYTTDYRTSKGRRRIIDLFANQEGLRLRPTQLDVLRARQEARLSLYRLLEVERNSLVITDLLRSRQHSVHDDLWSSIAAPGDVLLTRVIELEDAAHIDRVGTLLPPDAKDGLQSFAHTHFDHYCEEHYGAEWDDFLRESAYLFNHYLLSEEAESWHTAIKPQSPYYDALGVRERMESALRERADAPPTDALPQEAPSPIILPGDLIEKHMEDERSREDYATSQSGILLPGRPEHDEREKPPSILVPGRDF